MTAALAPAADRFTALLTGAVWQAPAPIPCGTVAVADAFVRAGDNGGPWEATAPGVVAPWWHLRRGEEVAMAREEDLTNPAKWRRVRAL